MTTTPRTEPTTGVGGDPDLRRRVEELYATDAQARAAAPRAAVTAEMTRPGIRLPAAVAAAMTGYADRPALAERAREHVTDPVTGRTTVRLLPHYETTTFAELWQRVRAVAGEWHHHGDHPLRAGNFVAILGFTSPDYTILDLTCVHLGAVSVPLQTGATATQIGPILAETEPTVLATSAELVDTAVAAIAEGATPARVVVFDYDPRVDEQRERVEAATARLLEAGVTVDTLDDLAARGARGAAAPLFTVDTPAEDDPLSLLIYTSGSTGAPKGAMYPESLVRGLWSGDWLGTTDLPVIAFNYMPMSHLAGRVNLIGSLARGGIAYFAARSDLSTLLEDMALARPTDLFLVPRVCDLLYQQFRGESDRRAADPGARATDADVKTWLREEVLGGRVLRATTGTAPLSVDMAAFVESTLRQRLHDGYGATESGKMTMDGVISRPPVTDYKLVDVPELGYFRTDSPYPRGELLIKSRTMFPGYYKRPEVTAEVFDADGYYRTGDIMAEIGPDRLVYVDRRKNVLKLSQGEFVAVSHLEAVYVASPLVRQVYVYGSSMRSYLLAVVVPTDTALDRYAGDGAALKAAVLDSLRTVARDTGLNSYEVPRDVIVETEPFTAENGLLSDVRKLLRPRLKEHYGDRLEALYQELAAGEADQLTVLRRRGREQPVLEAVTRAAAALLGTADEVSPDARFTDLGGDSLSALTLSNLLREVFDVEVPVGVVTSPANDLRRLADYIDGRLRSGAKRPTFAAVHGRDATRAHAADLTLDKFVDADTLAAAPTLPRAGETPRTVLLTGANGYLGRFLCLEWLRRVAAEGGLLVCLVRGTDADAAHARLAEVFDTDPALRVEFRDLAGHLRVLAGDIGEPDLGLDADTWRELADSIDLIVHPAALVNHVLPYEQLFGPNVVGTAELIRMALTTRLKPITYLSTVAVISGADDPAAVDESADIRAASPTRTLDEGYAVGYATSKWAGEVLLREAHELYGLPVAVFRSDMILAHSRYTGQVNVPDMFTRLLLSVLATGIAPRSFYTGDATRAHYDGLPADFTADAVTALSPHEGFATYNVLNPHDDGVSLDVFVDWLIDSGHRVGRVQDYAEWFDRFVTGMRALPERKRQASLLPLVEAFARPSPAAPELHVSTERFRAAVREAGVGPDRDIPHVTRALIDKYVGDLRGLGLL